MIDMTNTIKNQIQAAAQKTIETSLAEFKNHEKYEEIKNHFTAWVDYVIGCATEENMRLYRINTASEHLTTAQRVLDGIKRFGQQSKTYHAMLLKNLA